ncbi:MAG: endolytic transglycosylase MltG [Treponema sp.]|nr:endolytic transglycosylase MltG [Spirochaetales bacterium]MDY4901676.1 endolytic transglycosylase MltG [Treponema sp.]
MKNKFIKFLVTLFAWIAAVAAVCVVILISAWKHLTSPVDSSVQKNDTIEITIPYGSTSYDAAEILYSNQLIKSRQFFYIAARFGFFSKDSEFSLQSGIFRLSKGMNLEEIFTVLQSPGQEEYISVSIPEGLTAVKIGHILEKNGVCPQKDFLEAVNSAELCREFSIPVALSPDEVKLYGTYGCLSNFKDMYNPDFRGYLLEGFLFPDTYFFTPGMSGENAVRKMVSNFFDKIQELNLSVEDFETLYKKLILASIVEKEYKVPSEAPVISSVFTNRLNKNIGFYSCATIEYIITQILGRDHPERIFNKDLELESAFNTYKWAGLTPSPISNPGLIALDAAVNPAETDYYFFVLTDVEKGTHTFSKTFDQHIAAENINYLSKKSRSN